MNDGARDAMLREMAENRGCKLVKSRRRKPGTGDYGRYGLRDAKTGQDVFGFGKNGLIATPEEIEAHLRGAALSTWKSSLKNVGKAATGKPKAKARTERSEPCREERKARPREQTPPEPPEEPELRIRDMDSADADAVAALIVELGHDVKAQELGERIARLARRGEPPLVAKLGPDIVGCVTWHVMSVLHRPRPVGRITLLIVTKAARGRGIGKALVAAVEARLADHGSGLVEVTSRADLKRAHAFYQSLGYRPGSRRFAKELK